MKVKSRFLALLLAMVMALGLMIPAAASEEAAPADNSGKIVILHTNDVHCAYEHTVKDDAVTGIGYAGVAAYKAKMEAEYGADNVTMVDAGDAIQGGNIGSVSKGSYLVDIMNKVGYDLAIPGNHEFDYGMDNFRSLAAEKAEYTYLCCNFTDLDGKAVFDAYKMLSYGDVKVAYVGIDTPETFTKSTPTFFQNEAGEFIYSFAEKNNGQDLYAAVQKTVDAAKAEGADYVVAVAHLGDNGSTEEWKAQTVIANTTGIDVLIDGHSHEQIEKTAANKDGKNVVWAQTGTKLANLGKIVIDTKTGEITPELIPAAELTEVDEEITKYVDSIKSEFQAEMEKVVAVSEVELTTKDADGNRLVRSGETNLGDLCADAYRAVGEADVGLMNGGGIRADIAAGDVTMGNILDVYTFGNEVCLAEVTGRQLLEALEMGARNYPEENGGFLHVSGMTYTIKEEIPSPVVLDEAKMFVKLDGPNRVTDVTVGGQPLDLEKTYTVCGHNYMLQNGGDGFAMFGKNINVLRPGMMVDNAGLVQYIVEDLDGKITAEQYGESAGRITIVKAAPVEKPEEPAPEEKPAEPAPVEKPAEPVPEEKPAVSPNTYEVVKGDCLWKIAQKFYGTGVEWSTIYEANKDTVKNPDEISVGQVLVIPAK